jgi:signal transduction histidine kinase
VLDKLLVKLIAIAIEDSGIQSGCLLLAINHQLEIAAIIKPYTISIFPASDEGSGLVPLEVVDFVAHTLEKVVVDQTSVDNLFSQDAYILEHQPTSILCTPLIHASKLVGILYLENFTSGAITAQRLEILQFLFTQAATAFDDTRLYQQIELDVEEHSSKLVERNDRLQAEILERQKSEQILKSIVEGTVSVTGVEFFRSLVRSLAQALGVRYAFISECMDAPPTRVRSFAFWQGNEFGEEFEYDLQGTPCERIIGSNSYQCFPTQLQTLFPEDQDIVDMAAQSYAGIPLLTSSGKLLGHLAVLDDKQMESSERNQAIIEIFAARAGAEMERLQIEKAVARLAEIGELSATIVHEVRNPLTTIMMGLNAFKKLQLTDRFQEYLTLSIDEADRLERLLSQILLYSRPQTLDRSLVELNSFITETLSTLQTIPIAIGKNLNFCANISPVNILVDRDKLKQVLINLITNSCEAINMGDAITIRIEESDSYLACIHIHNGGAPIPADILPELTKPFFTTKASGTGLGLSIVKRIVEAHDGEFTIESSSEFGSIVKVKLPMLFTTPN